MIFMASSMSRAFRSGILASAIDRSCAWLSLPTLFLFGSPEPNRLKVGRISKSQLRSIAEIKLEDLNARDLDQAMLVIAGTARSMGVEVER